jgi:hypothetical protein
MIQKLRAALIVVLAPLAVYAGSQFFVGASVAALCPYYMPQPAQQPTQPQPAYERVVI